MKEKTDKLLTLVLLGVAIVTTLFAVLFALNTASGWFDVAFWIMAVMIAASLVAIVLFLCKKLAERFKSEPGYLKKFLLLIGVIVVLLAVSFLLAKGNDVDIVKYDIAEGTSKLIGAACILCYIIVVAAALAILYAEVTPKTNKKK